jgi:transmembrane 9 superfamily protein 2/4
LQVERISICEFHPLWQSTNHSLFYSIIFFRYEGSSAAIPFLTLVALLALWFCVSVPLTFVGAFFGFRKRAIEHPVRTNQIPRQIPEQSIYTQPIPGKYKPKDI